MHVRWLCRQLKPVISYITCIVVIGNLLLLRHVGDSRLREERLVYSTLEADNRSLPNASYFKSDGGDMTKLILTQARIGSCYQRNTTDAALEKCLEEEYLRSRHSVIKAAAEKFKREGGRPPNSVPNIEDLEERTNQGRSLAKKYYDRRSTKVNPFLYHLVARPQNGCDVDTYVIILIHSFHPYRDKRDAIRKTWGSVATGGSWPKEQIAKKLRLVFVLGTHVDRECNDVITSELKQHDDIIQGDFIDDYTNMTLKSLLGLKYVMEACPSTPFVLKSDDDMIINLPYLLQILQDKTYTRSIMGPRNSASKPQRVGKWGVSRQLFPFSRYPVYESGAAYVITGDLVRDLFETSEYVPAFHVDDVYITGVLGRILKVNHVRQKGFAYWGDKVPTACDMIRRRKITGTKMTPARLLDIWGNISTVAC